MAAFFVIIKVYLKENLPKINMIWQISHVV